MPGLGGEALWGTAFGVASALAVLIAGAAGVRIGMRRAQRAHEVRSRAQRVEANALQELARGPRGWSWRTDATMRVTQLDGMPPAGSRPWPGAALLSLVSDVEGAGAPGLPALLDARARIERHPVRLSGAKEAEAFELAAAPTIDPEGRFGGYLGFVYEAALPTAPAGDVADEALSFTFTLSHDLRAPVRVVEGFARILKEDYGTHIDRVGNDHVDRVLAAAARMNQMIDALLAMAKLASQPLQRQPVDLSRLAGWIVDELKRGAPERRIEFEIEPGLHVQGDPTLLRQMLENLLGNAWKYTQRQPDARVRFEREIVDGRPGYAVRDNGAGFDMRSVDRLFGLFQRLHSASEFPGTGVGLASVRRIVARHGGRIWAEADPGRGATFHFTLRD